uniref:DNA ligase n=1 Tax=Chionoecetes opilio bacilliform virus TaxID=1825681 RepID=A0A1Q3DLF7_9VIRU|nr:DNA ligase III [Chionoecetes opilio bacilliform virus]GAV93215.1 hypothetical protein SCV_095 [Chionoecetes opilio bacilliform virus]
MRFCAEYAKENKSLCVRCKCFCEKGVLRIGSILSNGVKKWYHVICLTGGPTDSIQNPQEDIAGWETLRIRDKILVKEMLLSNTINYWNLSPVPNPDKRDNFHRFRILCKDISAEPGSLSKSHIVRQCLSDVSDIQLWVFMLLPGVRRRVYNLQNKQIIKIFAKIFETGVGVISYGLETGELSQTVANIFKDSKIIRPQLESTLTLIEVDALLEELSGKTKMVEQTVVLRHVTERCTVDDLEIFIRLIKADLRINAGAKPILNAITRGAFQAFRITNDLSAVMRRVKNGENLEITSANVMTPVLPMLAEACTSVEEAFKKIVGICVEIKYDGERIQVHMKDGEVEFFSRSRHPVAPHKIEGLHQCVLSALPNTSDFIIDAEILLVTVKDGEPAAFGTLGKHKMAELTNNGLACSCLFVFDCLWYNGQSLMNHPLQFRRSVLEGNMINIENRVMLVKTTRVESPEELQEVIIRALHHRLEGLVLKDAQGTYEPGKRHWLKVKKDYLLGGSLADSVDLVVLGAWYGSGKKVGKKSVFLMGCRDERCDNKWYAVTKVHTGHDNATLEKLQHKLDMVKISKNSRLVPFWLKLNKRTVPDFVATDPKNSPVWEITGSRFTYTVDGGISIRFPRVTKERDDKNWLTATSLLMLQELYEKSKMGIQSKRRWEEEEEGSYKRRMRSNMSLWRPPICELG